MDAQTISAFAAAGAALAAASVAGIQLYVGHRQSQAALRSAEAAMMSARNVGQHRIAEFRQNWIDNVIDTLSGYHATLLAADPAHELSKEDAKTLTALRTKLEILLNPDETDTVDLINATDEILHSKTSDERKAKSPQMVKVARRLLKREWVRLKNELASNR